MSVSAVTVVRAEGARVGFVVCEECSAAILLDPRAKSDAAAEHIEWHNRYRKHTELIAELTGASSVLLNIRDAEEDCSADDLRQMAAEALQRAA
jgi:hypothetical protein